MSELSRHIFSAGMREGISPKLIAAVIMQESAGEMNSCRFEEAWFDKNLAGKDRSDLAGFVPPRGSPPSLYDEKVWRAHSWGVMHILGDTARLLGYREKFLPGLIYPEMSIFYGTMFLGRCFRRARTQSSVETDIQRRALLYYNGGGNPEYPKEVETRIGTPEVELLIGD